MPPLVQALLAAFAVSTISLVGIVFVFGPRWSHRNEMAFVSFSAGVLLAAAFLELFPEALAHTGPDGRELFVAPLVAMIAFFFLERLLHGFHEHDGIKRQVPAMLILIGDALHNFVDGVVIAASFLASPTLGVATTVAVAAHELPHEIADFAILARGTSRRRALLLNFGSGLTALIGVVACYAFEELVRAHLAACLAGAAGMFIYVSGSDLIPELHHDHHERGGWLHTAPFVLGIGLVGLLSLVLDTPH
jgi:zinc and cadmium transporter